MPRVHHRVQHHHQPSVSVRCWGGASGRPPSPVEGLGRPREIAMIGDTVCSHDGARLRCVDLDDQPIAPFAEPRIDVAMPGEGLAFVDVSVCMTSTAMCIGRSPAGQPTLTPFR